MGKVIGIDLGTTNSCISVVEGGKAVIIQNADGGRTTPSMVAFTNKGERLIGESAKRQAVMNPACTFSSFKRHMGSEYKMDVYGKEYTPQEISAMVLRKLKEDAESYLGTHVKEAVITVPAYFNDAQRQATKDAGKIAGLSVKRIINEPTAAALAYGLDNEEDQRILVYDLGGGTFDVSVISIGDGIIEVLATSGDTYLGGDDFDAVLVAWMLKECKEQCKVDLSTDRMAMQRIKEEAEKVKKNLSSAMQSSISLPFITMKNNMPIHFEKTITRAEFEHMVMPLVEKTAGPVMQALQDAELSADDIDKVLLVGGSTRMPCIQRQVTEIMGQEPCRGINPDECVAIGAAIQGGKLSGDDETATDLLLLDVTPLSLSIETMGGVSTVLIERNTTIPTRKSQIFSTASDNQTSVDIHVLQGEREMAKDNKTLGRFILDGIPPAKMGEPQILVTFDIDANGIVSVSAQDMATEKEQRVTIEASSNMAKTDIDSAIEEAAVYEAADKRRKASVEMFNVCQSFAYKAKGQLENMQHIAEGDEGEEIKERLEKLDGYLKNNPESLDEYSMEQMSRIMDDVLSRMKSLSEVMYDRMEKK